MGKYIPYRRAKNYAKHRCHNATIAVSDSGHTAISEYMQSHSNGSWTYSWGNSKTELTVYSKDQEALTYVSMLRE